MDDTRKCPYCAEDIPAAAVRCRFCRSRLTDLDPERWHRDHGERRLAGVAVAVARGLVVPLGAVRVAFIALAFFHLLGPILYGALWLLIPYAPGDPSLFEQGIGRLRTLLHHLFPDHPGAGDRLP